MKSSRLKFEYISYAEAQFMGSRGKYMTVDRKTLYDLINTTFDDFILFHISIILIISVRFRLVCKSQMKEQ